jgi:two-component system, response regulator RegA
VSTQQEDFFPNPAVSPAGTKGMILLVEDDAVLRMMLRTALESSGYEVTESDSRPDALVQLREQASIAVAIVDLGLPPVEHTTLEGLATLRAINSDYPAVKAIVLTGQDEEKAAFDAIKEGAFDFLAKPARTADILQAVQRAFLFHRKELDLMADGLARLHFNARYTDGLKAVREEAEEKLVRQVLKETGFNVYKSAEKLGIKRESIYYFMKKFQITRDNS